MEANERWAIGEDNDVFVIGNGDCVAKVCGAPEGIKNSIGRAHLIAAAPDLLEALEMCEDYIQHIRPKVPTWYVETINAAIAKARGGA